MKNLCLLLFIFIPFASCSFAPFNSGKTARSLGKDKWGVSTGLSAAPYVSVSKGMTENFDLFAKMIYC